MVQTSLLLYIKLSTEGGKHLSFNTHCTVAIFAGFVQPVYFSLLKLWQTLVK